MINKYELCEHFNKSQAWLSTPWGKKRIKQCISMTGGETLSHFVEYQAMQIALITEVKNCLTYKEIATFFDGNYPYQKGYRFINRLAYRLYDEDYFLAIDVIEKLRKMAHSIKDIE